MNLIPGLSLRADDESEVAGIDDAELGEFAYDYVELSRDVIAADDNTDGESISMFSRDRGSQRLSGTLPGSEKNGIPLLEQRMYANGSVRR